MFFLLRLWQKYGRKPAKRDLALSTPCRKRVGRQGAKRNRLNSARRAKPRKRTALWDVVESPRRAKRNHCQLWQLFLPVGESGAFGCGGDFAVMVADEIVKAGDGGCRLFSRRPDYGAC